MSENKYNLNLPETQFPMRGNLPKREPEMLTKWNQDDVYALVRKSREGKPLFILHDGPPYANGTIHLGHALNKILKDIIVKAKTIEGYDAPYIPGWDCHGLPIELKVESLVGKPGVNIDAKEFRQKCREYALEQVDLQRQDFMRLGVLGDWYNPYLTMNYDTEAEIIRTLARLVDRGHMFKGHKPVYWCVDCESALAEAEVEYRDKKSDSIYVAFAAEDKNQVAERFGVKLEDNSELFSVIWTTTPWTIPGNRAISLHPEIEYVLVKAVVENNQYFAEPKYFVLAKELVEAVAQAVGFASYEVVGHPVKGADLDLLQFVHPLFGFNVPFILGEHVGLDAGTGLVHTAPDNGLEDFEVCKQYNIPLANIINDKSEFKADVPKFAGLKIFDANVPVIKELAAAGRLLKNGKITHSYPHCWRHKTPVVYRATPQWFIGMDTQGLRTNVLDEIKQVDWIPSWGQNRIESMVETRPDWCISRQRTWGVPIPVYTNKETGELHPQTQEIFEKVAKLVEKDGIQAWWDVKDEDLLGEDYANWTKAKDTLDVWFDSGSTSQVVVAKRPEFKGKVTDLYLEGSDQHRGWFMSSICIGAGVTSHSPYRAVLTHGFIVDGLGQKMSKSIGNVIVPQEVNQKYGADILRLWVAQSDYTKDIRVSDEVLKRSADVYRRLRNTTRFLLANLHGFDPEKDLVAFQDMLPVDRYILSQASKLQESIRKNYNSYQLHLLVKDLVKFCSVDLGSFYLDIVKDRIYTMKKDSLARRSAQTAMYHLAEALSRWFAPIISFTAQEVWEHIPGKRDPYVFTQYYYDQLPCNDTPYNDEFWTEVLKVRELANAALEQLRNANVIGSSLEAKLTIYAGRKLRHKLELLGDEAKFAFLVSKVEFADVEEYPNLVEGQEVYVVAEKYDYPKCALCWHHDETVGQNPEYPDLCARSISNLFGEGEVRRIC